MDIVLLDNGIPIDLTGHEIRLYAKKPDTMEVYNEGVVTDAEAGRAQIEMTTQLLAAVGYIEAQIIIFEENTEILSTLPFKIFVVKSLMTDHAIESSNEYGALVVLYQNLYEAYDLMTEMVQKIGIPGHKAESLNLDTMFEVWDYLIEYLENNSSAGVVERIGNPGDTTPETLFGMFEYGQSATAQILTTAGQSVTASQDGITKSATADSNGVAKFKLGLGFWDIAAEVNYKVLIEQTGKLYTMSAGDKLKLDDCTWGLIDLLAKQGLASQFFGIGDTKDVEIKGEQVKIQILGFNHDDLASGGKAKISLGMVNAFNGTRRMNATNDNTTSWQNSEMRAWMQSALINDLPNDLKAVIKPVKKKTAQAGNNTTLVTTTDSLFLFSEYEVAATTTNSNPGEGTKYAYYTDANSRIKMVKGTNSNWWLRSPAIHASFPTQYFAYVNNAGAVAYDNATNARGVAIGLCVWQT